MHSAAVRHTAWLAFLTVINLLILQPRSLNSFSYCVGRVYYHTRPTQ